MVEGCPATLKEAVSKEDADKIKADVEGAGGKALSSSSSLRPTLAQKLGVRAALIHESGWRGHFGCEFRNRMK